MNVRNILNNLFFFIIIFSTKSVGSKKKLLDIFYHKWDLHEIISTLFTINTHALTHVHAQTYTHLCTCGCTYQHKTRRIQLFQMQRQYIECSKSNIATFILKKCEVELAVTRANFYNLSVISRQNVKCNEAV